MRALSAYAANDLHQELFQEDSYCVYVPRLHCLRLLQDVLSVSRAHNNGIRGPSLFCSVHAQFTSSYHAQSYHLQRAPSLDHKQILVYIDGDRIAPL